MSDARLDRLRQVCDLESSRSERARTAAETIAAAEYRWVAIYEVEDDEIAVLGEFGTGSQTSNAAVTAGPLAMGAFVTNGGVAIVPILGAESAVVIGALAVERASPAAYDEEERGALERYAAVVIALFE
jgi:putative methionine-R-sulfoxide reductase with GAF domain